MPLVRAALVAAPAELPAWDTTARIGMCRAPEWEAADAASRRAVEEAAANLARAGADVRDVTLPPPFQHVVAAQKTVMAFEAARDLAYEYECRRDGLRPLTVGFIEQGLATRHAEYAAAVATGRQARRVLAEVFAEVDALICPSALGEAPAGLDSTGDALFNRAWTLTGNPCVNLPGHTGPNGLPVGVQLVGDRDHDDRLLGLCAWAAPLIG